MPCLTQPFHKGRWTSTSHWLRSFDCVARFDSRSDLLVLGNLITHLHTVCSSDEIPSVQIPKGRDLLTSHTLFKRGEGARKKASTGYQGWTGAANMGKVFQSNGDYRRSKKPWLLRGGQSFPSLRCKHLGSAGIADCLCYLLMLSEGGRSEGRI